VSEKTITLSLHGLDNLDDKTKAGVVWLFRKEFEPIVNEAGKTLRITTGQHRGDLNLSFNADPAQETKKACVNVFLGEDGTGSVSIGGHKNLRVCSPPDPKTGKRDIRRILTNHWLLAHALANTGMHELGHFIADLDHSTDGTNYMVDGSAPLAERNIRNRREWFAGQQNFTAEQRQNLVAQLKTEEWLGDFTFETK
jgi:hypothetical protein